MNTTITQLRSTLNSILAVHHIYGAQQNAAEVFRRVQDGGFCSYVVDLSLSWDQAWGVGANLRVTIQREEGTKGGYGGRVPCVRFRTSCNIGWSSTGRDVKSATAALALYRQVVDLAALIEAATDGLEEEVEAKPVPVSSAEEVAK